MALAARGSAWWLPVVVLLVLLPAGELAVGLVNHLLTLLLPPRVLPKLDFKDGIPADYAAFVVMPSMLVRPQSAADLLERLEIHHLANPDPRLRFALLTDFADAPAETMPEDAGYLRDAVERVKALNAALRATGRTSSSSSTAGGIWNPAQGCWMGWERKRGKLSEFNRLLRGDRGTSYSVVSRRPRRPAARPVRDHARLRHQDDPRHRRPADRHDRAPAQPAAVRPGGRAGWSRGTGSCSRGSAST